jgi:hypothetical protein
MPRTKRTEAEKQKRLETIKKRYPNGLAEWARIGGKKSKRGPSLKKLDNLTDKTLIDRMSNEKYR